MSCSLLIGLLTADVLAADPSLSLSWKRGVAALTVSAPAGEHIAPEPVSELILQVGGETQSWEGSGAMLEAGLQFTLPDPAQGSLSGSARFSLCEDGGSLCRLVEYQLEGQLTGARGRTLLKLSPPEPPPEELLLHPLDAEQGFAEAQASGKRVLLDFSTTWCPPCQVLLAEILHDPEEADLLEPFVVIELNADHPSSFELKSRYQVGGYPTLILAEPDGTLVDRMEGYPGEESMRSWLRASREEPLSLSQLMSSLDSLEGAPLEQAARRLLQSGELEAASVLAERLPESPSGLLLRFQLAPQLSDLEALFAQDFSSLPDWLWSAYRLVVSAGDPEQQAEAERLRSLLVEHLRDAIPKLDPMDAADVTYVLARLEEDSSQQRAWYGVSAALAQQGLTGDLRLDRGHLKFVADCLSLAGDTEAALRFLEPAREAYAEESTYHAKAAQILQRAQRYEEALAAAQQATSVAVGDNILTLIADQAELLSLLERAEEARALLETTLSELERPAEGLEVRTWRYIKQLEELLAELQPD